MSPYWYPRTTEKLRAQRWPHSFMGFAILGAICLLTGLGVLAGLLQGIQPLFNDEMAGIALIVSAIACFVSGAFPLVLSRLAEREGGE